MKKEKKKYLIPEAEIIFFANNDVIATSALVESPDDTYGDWDGQDGENW